MINRSDIAIHLERSIRTGFLVGKKEYSPVSKPFVRETPSDGAFETYGDMGVTPWPVGNAGKQGAAGTDSKLKAPKVNQMTGSTQIQILGGEEKGLVVYNVDWEVAIGITHNAIDDDRIGDIEAWARTAGANFERHKDFLVFDALANGAATTKYGACYDGLSFFNAAHKDPGAAYQTNQTNVFALALSLDNFETVKVAASKFLNGIGQPVGLAHNLLVVPPDLERIAAQIVGNQEDYATADRKINPYSGKTQMIVAPGGWLGTTKWFLIDPTLPQKPLMLQLRKNPELTITDDELTGDGGVRYYKWHSRYSVFYGDWRLAVKGND